MSTSSAEAFLDLAAQRRSVYAIDDEGDPVPVARIEAIVRKSLEICPSPWNIKSSCAMVLYGQHHKFLFNSIVLPEFEAALPTKAFETMKPKIEGLAAGLGTVLFFENQDVWDKLVESSPRSKPMADPWSNVVSGMLQYTVWTALANAGLGCSLQHYDSNEKIVQKINAKYAIPESWKLKAELPFGHKYEEPGPVENKPYQSPEETFKIFA